MEIYKMFKTSMTTLLAVGIVVTGIPCNNMSGESTGLLVVQAATETDPNDLIVYSPLTAEQQREITFNACYYANRYPDLKAVYGYDAVALYRHYLNWGIQEGRCASPLFDPAYYLEVQTDLKAAFGNDYVAAYRHWLQNGYFEERESSEYYNGVYYRENNSDLAGMDSYGLLHHFLTFGIFENRIANQTGLQVDAGMLKAYYPQYTGNSGSITTVLDELNVDSSMVYRKRIALANGIEDYSGTAEQNTHLLKLLRQGMLVNPKATEDSTKFETGILLNVEDMKQFKKEWSNVELGKSGQTIGKIGCTVTCLAMTESYRTGSIITPKEMATRLKFTSKGGLYWPSNYVEYTGGDYLQKLQELLAEGKPAMICSKNNRTGKQHWVVVTGYNGNGLSPENFTINDPGSSYRKTLQEFLDAYYRDYGCTYKCLRYYK